MSNIEGERKLQRGQLDLPESHKTDESLKRAQELLIELRALRHDPGGPVQVGNVLDVVDFLLSQYIVEA